MVMLTNTNRQQGKVCARQIGANLALTLTHMF